MALSHCSSLQASAALPEPTGQETRAFLFDLACDLLLGPGVLALKGPISAYPRPPQPYPCKAKTLTICSGI